MPSSYAKIEKVVLNLKQDSKIAIIVFIDNTQDLIREVWINAAAQ